ncbi:Vacuolar protein sorting-associated protein 62 [Yamadazyma tenuis]|uniref:Vacuolar protein sorting-associated protein 62 n=1 Tax=Candida tenuis (strain ATCC 10573 / BCRC 21748 / CBS 615 / JCM 9827 / NBRC 10315 / NRRL Y-1498 / VKM Y-70) TaxID=590646 RepID=G3B2Q5_CANTC|nr:uncharacterized protein CANTEDRAFT_113515 [Yamadazyma tenuis ATCC 10573]EGV64733.1 hypothetical protein CANTEDRAFT_113515 [Yamadazyma tenuis ATCC 10573]WEJ97525.1 Vacuolar protein sorting-associated protein 62 [Yamadazyma tenuis]
MIAPSAVISLCWLVLSTSVAASAVPYWQIDKGYIHETLTKDTANINSMLRKAPGQFRHLPPIVDNPTPFQRSIQDGEVPDYILEYAPVVHLYSEERYLPYDIGKFVTHFHVEYDNGTTVPGTEANMNLKKLSELPEEEDYFLTSNSDFDSDPEWITGIKNKPSLATGEIKDAPAVLIVVDKGNGWVDAYWFYFYSFNLGPFVMGSGPYGNHVGDWEHSLVRYYNGEPVIVWMSAHGGGQAFYYHNLEKYESNPNHPILFSARGTHANYVSVGQHPHDLPYAILSDFTDRGPLWNPTKNYLAYTFDGTRVYPATTNRNPHHVGREKKYHNWLKFWGRWGDRKLPDDDNRQRYSFIGGYKYIDGPRGPLMKNLLRIKPCERHKWWNFWAGCNVRQNIKWGIGVESEGYNCGNVFISIKPNWLRKIIQHVTWGGFFCYAADIFYG